MKDGKQLEALVAFVEETLLPKGFEVKTNRRIFDDEGHPIGEFDVEIRGSVGSTQITWLIECRDRPRSGPAPVSWIEQLVGRRDRFKFDKITAVSSTGFAAGAVEFAQREGIELRELTSASPESISSWLQTTQFRHIKNVHVLNHANIYPEKTISAAEHQALTDLIEGTKASEIVLRSTVSGARVKPCDAFIGAVALKPFLFEGLTPNGPSRSVDLTVEYVNDSDCFAIDTKEGAIRIAAIRYIGELSIQESEIPLAHVSSYKPAISEHPISQVAAFEPRPSGGDNWALEFHKIEKTGETHVVLRKTGPAKSN